MEAVWFMDTQRMSFCLPISGGRMFTEMAQQNQITGTVGSRVGRCRSYIKSRQRCQGRQGAFMCLAALERHCCFIIQWKEMIVAPDVLNATLECDERYATGTQVVAH